jgi:hypothetical protein
MSHTYLMTLTPLGDFFFGGEHTLGADDERNEPSRYHAVSRLMPSQSVLIGALRKTMLIEAGHLTLHKRGEWVDSRGKKAGNNTNYDAAKTLVGNRPFSYTQPNDLGTIAFLSPLYLRKGDIYYTPMPFDNEFEPKTNNRAVVRMDDQEIPAMVFEGYDPKKGLPDKLWGTDGSYVDRDEFFQSVSTVGIKKSLDGKTEEKAFYLKDSYKLQSGIVFVFELHTTVPLPFEKTRIELGADRSAFILEAQSTDISPDIQKRFESIIEPKTLPRVVAHSEVILSATAAQKCTYIVGQRSRQRMIVSGKRGAFKKGDPFFRYERGSVFYTQNIEELTADLDPNNLSTFGINQIITTQGA